MTNYTPIQDLTIVGSIGNNDLFPLSDGSGAYAVRGSTIKSYAATDAAAAAADAAASKTAAQNAATAAGNAQTVAEGAAATAASAVSTAEGAVAQVTALQDTPINADMVKVEFAPALTSGYYSSDTGKAGSSSGQYVRSSALWNGNGTRSAILLDNNAYKFKLTFYDSTGTTSGTGFLRASGYKTGVIYIPADAALIGLTFARVDGSNMTSSDNDAVLAALYAYKPTDTDLTERGKAADGRTVGAKLDKLRYAQYAGNAKNVLDFAELTTASSAGRKWTVNSDGSITVSGTPSGNSQFTIFYNTSAFPEWITKGKTYYVRFNDADIYYSINYRKNGEWVGLVSEAHGNSSFTVPDDDDVVGFAFRLWIDYTAHPEAITKTFRIYTFDQRTNAQLNSRIDTVTDAKFNQLRYAQYAGNAKNVVDDVDISASQSSGGRKWTVNADRSISVSGTPSAVSIFTVYYDLSVFPDWITKGKNYYVVYADDVISYSIGYRKNGAWNNLMDQSYTSGSFRVPVDDEITGFFVRLSISYQDHPEAISKTVRFFIFDQKPNSVLATETGTGVRLPDYWQSYMEDKIQTIQQGDCNYHTGDSFVFSTDNHWEKNTKNSGALAQYIAENSSVKKIILGGDLITYHADKQAALDVINDVMTAFGGEPFVACGNHDDNGESTDVQGPEKLLILERYGTITRKFNTKIHPYRSGNNVYTYYTILNDADMFAYVVLDSTDYDYSATQLNWLSAQLTALYQTYHIVIITHMHSASDGTVLENTGGKLETLLAGLDSSVTDKIIAIFAGHIHRDRVYRTSTGIPIIITKCDTYQQEHDSNMIPGTTTEQVLDVVHIDLDSETIYLTRIGSGNDRTVTFREATT